MPPEVTNEDPRVTILRKWEHDLDPYDYANDDALRRLLSALDSARASEPEGADVERVAASIYSAKWNLEWSGLADEKKDDFRRYARAAITAMRRPVGGERALGLAKALFRLVLVDPLAAAGMLEAARELVALLEGKA